MKTKLRKDNHKEDSTMRSLVTTNRIGHSLDRMFNDLFNGVPVWANANSDFAPKVNITENDRRIRLEFELPGMDKGDINVTVKDGLLTVSGERKVETKDEKENYVRSEIYTGQFSRSFTLPETVETDKISADYKNGILTLGLPKSEKAQPKQIEVKVS
jgi:HSP20 family protein